MSQTTFDFEVAAGAPKPSKRPAPFSLRLNAEERATLQARAGRKPLGAYIRAELFGSDAAKRRSVHRPKADDALLAKALSELGASRLSSNLNQLAKAANMGTLPVSRDVTGELEEACAAVADMRARLIEALGVKDGHGQ